MSGLQGRRDKWGDWLLFIAQIMQDNISDKSLPLSRLLLPLPMAVLLTKGYETIPIAWHYQTAFRGQRLHSAGSPVCCDSPPRPCGNLPNL